MGKFRQIGWELPAEWQASVTQLDAPSDWRPGGRVSQPRWLSWMPRPTGDQEVAGSTPRSVTFFR